MLSKAAERVLKQLLSNFSGDFFELVNVCPNEELCSSFLNASCYELLEHKLIDSFYESRSEQDPARVYLKMEGFDYFKRKRKEKIKFWIPTIATILSGIGSVIAILF